MQTTVESSPISPSRKTTPVRTLAPLKISLYEYILCQLRDDGFGEAADRLSEALQLTPFHEPSKDALFTLYERALFDPVTLRAWLLDLKRQPQAPSLASVWRAILGPHDWDSKQCGNEDKGREEESRGMSIEPRRKRLRVSSDEDREAESRNDETDSHQASREDGQASDDSDVPVELFQRRLYEREQLRKYPWIYEWIPIKLSHRGLSSDRRGLLDFDRQRFGTVDPAIQETGDETQQPPAEGAVTDDAVLSKSKRDGLVVPTVHERWATAHKGACTSLAVTRGISLAASGGVDQVVRVVVARPMGDRRSEQPSMDEEDPSFSSSLPVWTRVFHQDHSDAITALAFAPDGSLLYSGSRDCSVRIYEISKPQYRRSSHVLKDVYPINCLAVHPSNSMLYCGTNHPIIRCYDTKTLRCFSSLGSADHHSGSITDLTTSVFGSVLFSSSSDGSIQIWDAVSNRLVNRMSLCHSGMDVWSIRLSQSQKYLMSAGSDGKARIWDLRNGLQAQLLTCNLRMADGLSSGKCKAVFLSNDTLVASISDDKDNIDIRLHDAYGGRSLGELNYHSSKVLNIEASMDGLHLLTACEDNRCRCLALSSLNVPDKEL